MPGAKQSPAKSSDRTPKFQPEKSPTLAASPLNSAASLLRSIRDMGQTRIIVGVSGGKDSIATLDVCHKVFGRGNVHGFFLYLVEGLECEEQHLRQVEGKYGMTLEKLPHPDLAYYLRFSSLRDISPAIEDRIHRNLRWVDVEAIMRQRTGAEWFAYGHRITDSLQRRAMIMSARGVLPKRKICYPIWNWNPTTVISYLRAIRVKIPGMFGCSISNTSGVSPHSTDCLRWLAKNYPADLKKLLTVFPHAENLLLRDELRAKYAIERNDGLDEAEREEGDGTGENTVEEFSDDNTDTE
jgi:phosphoadenosine phosphosulfate reductase